MRMFPLTIPGALCGAFLLAIAPQLHDPALAQDPAASGTETAAMADTAEPEELSADELEVLVARIALYPDELVAVIVASSLYPLQIVEAERYLGKVKTKADLKPDKTWDGSVISLLNYP